MHNAHHLIYKKYTLQAFLRPSVSISGISLFAYFVISVLVF